MISSCTGAAITKNSTCCDGASDAISIGAGDGNADASHAPPSASGTPIAIAGIIDRTGEAAKPNAAKLVPRLESQTMAISAAQRLISMISEIATGSGGQRDTVAANAGR